MCPWLRPLRFTVNLTQVRHSDAPRLHQRGEGSGVQWMSFRTALMTSCFERDGLRRPSVKLHSAATSGAAGAEYARRIQLHTATAEVNIRTRMYCAMGRLASPNTMRSRPKLALQVQSAK